MILLYCLLLQLVSAPSLATTVNTNVSNAVVSSLPQELRVVYPALSEVNKVDNSIGKVFVTFQIKDNELYADFTVVNNELNAIPHLSANQYPYQFDVVEVFIAIKNKKSPTPFPYYEFELSPYNESFQVKVLDLKKPFQEGLDFGLRHITEFTKDGWRARLIIPLQNLNWDQDPASIIGNAYAILGKSPQRKFYSLYLPLLKKPNFHQPQFFQSIFTKK